MDAQNKNAMLDATELEAEGFDFDELEERLQSQLEDELSDLDFLEEEKTKIGNPDNLGEVIQGVVWEQFMNQIAITAGEDFIRENNGLNLDLRTEAHIQTTENFADGKIATHNTKIDYQKRHDDWQSNFKKDENGQTITRTDRRTGTEKEVLIDDARAPFDKDRPKGSTAVNIDHTVAAAEIIRDPAANAHMTREDQIKFANSEKNLNPLDAAANQSKGDSTMTEFLDSERNGQKPADRFNIDEEQLRAKDQEAREEYEKQKKEGEKKSIEMGKQSQKEEAFRIGGKALRAVIMQLLADLVREIISKLIKWFKSAQKGLDTLLDSLKAAIHAFVDKIKTHIINAGNTVFSTVATAIIGPVFGTIKKVWMLLKQGWNSLKGAVDYIKKPENKGKPIGRLLLETGKIVIAGLTGVGAIVLGEVVEKGLMAIPIFAVEIPLIGSLANILGIFIGAVVAGIIGAIAINLIEKAIEKKQKNDNMDGQIDKKNEILQTQDKLIDIKVKKMVATKEDALRAMKDTREQAKDIISEAMATIFSEDGNEEDNADSLSSTADDLAELLS